MVEEGMTRGERAPTTLRALEHVHGKAAVGAKAGPGRTHQGPVVGYVIEDGRQGYVVLDSGQQRTAVRTDRRDRVPFHPPSP